MEDETSMRPAWEVDVHVGGWRALGHQSNHGGSHRGEPERRLAYKKSLEEGIEGTIVTKESGRDRGGSVSKEKS